MITNTKTTVLPMFFRLCTRALGNLVLKRTWIHFIQAKVYFLKSEIGDFYNLVNSPPKETVQSLPTIMIHSTLNPIKASTLVVSIGESLQEDSQCAIINLSISVETGELEQM